ncbi:MAG: methyltransferase protein [Acidimicrobiaceae bacterium]|nr:methyltransferase protein [Acidimicrobiaceae bacterium]
MLSHYHTNVDVEKNNSSHAAMLRMVGFNKRVLEAGCASGHVSEKLSAQGCTVVGIELDASVVDPARQWLERVIVGNLDDPSPWRELDEELFDVVLFGDVLEHLRDPLSTLRESLKYLTPSGIVVISVPNIAHADVKIALINGRFPYSDDGLLDRTHISFFTKESLLKLVKDAGLIEVEIFRVTLPVFHTEIGVEKGDVDGQVLEAILEERESETYQFVIKAVRDNGDRSLEALAGDLVELTDKLYDQTRRNQMLEAKLDGLEERVEAMTIQRQADARDLAHYRHQTDLIKRLLPTSLLRFIRSRST